jgi:hypothetical protein
VSNGDGSGFTGERRELPATILEPEPAASFEAMDEEIETLASSSESGDPVSGCEKPGVEITLLDEDSRPIAGATYKSEAPALGLAEGQLGEKGYVRVEDVDAQDLALTAELAVTEDDEGTRWEVVVVAEGEGVQEAPEAETEDEGPPPEEELPAPPSEPEVPWEPY